jgi:archaeal flagellin FlaB
MIHRKDTNGDGFTGLEAAIVLIAFVVVAAVFSYVVLGAGFFTSQKSQETVYKSVEQATSNIQMIGQVYGIDSGSTNTINKIQFGLGLAPGAPPIDISKMIIVVAQPDTDNKIQMLTYSAEAAAGSNFGVYNPATKTNDRAIAGQNQETITIALATGLTANQKISIEIRPAVGGTLPLTRTVPPTLKSSQVLF